MCRFTCELQTFLYVFRTQILSRTASRTVRAVIKCAVDVKKRNSALQNNRSSKVASAPQRAQRIYFELGYKWLQMVTNVEERVNSLVRVNADRNSPASPNNDTWISSELVRTVCWSDISKIEFSTSHLAPSAQRMYPKRSKSSVKKNN